MGYQRRVHGEKAAEMEKVEEKDIGENVEQVERVEEERETTNETEGKEIVGETSKHGQGEKSGTLTVNLDLEDDDDEDVEDEEEKDESREELDEGENLTSDVKDQEGGGTP